MSTQDFTRFRGRLQIRGELILDTPLRIGAGGGDDMGLADIAVVKDALGRPYIPGSSFKGVLRSTVEMVLRTINPQLACLCTTYQDGHYCPTTKRRQKEPDEERSPYKERLADFNGDEDALYLKGACRVCEVFGSPGLASKVQIPDMKLAGEWYGRYQLRNGVSIDRDTETAAEGRLYTSEAVPAGTQFACEIVVENASEAEQGLVLLGLKAFERGAVMLGGATSRGLGKVRLIISSCQEIRDSGTDLLAYLVDGTTADVDEAARLEKIQSLRQALERYNNAQETL